MCPPRWHMEHNSYRLASDASRLTRIGSQLIATTVAWFAAILLHHELRVPAESWSYAIAALPYLLAARLVTWHRGRIDRVYWAHVGLRDLLVLGLSSAAGSLVAGVVIILAGSPLAGALPVLLPLEFLLVVALTASVWAAARWFHERSQPRSGSTAARALILGAGDAGEQLLRQLQHDARYGITVVGLVDDDQAKRGRTLHGVPVVGTVADLRQVAAIHQATVALVAVPSISPEQLRRIVAACREAQLAVRLLPPLRELIHADVRPAALREVRLEDLLGREPIQLDLSGVERELTGKTILVTGAAGSIGSELVRQITAFRPSSVLLLDRAESPLHNLHVELSSAFPEIRFVPVLASVTNIARLDRVFRQHQPAIVFHAAAYKQLPLLEWNVVEGFWNNVIGTLNVARCAATAHAERFVLISTDKAVNPSSVLGVTKLLAERVVLETPSLRSAATDFRVVRFGNVLGSEGSVVPLFTRQIAAGGPVTVTHPDVRRYFMTIPEASQLVLEAATLPEAAGQTAVLEMGTQVRIVELAEQMIHLAGRVPHEEIPIVFTGLRTGEKLEEQLVGPGESSTATTVEKIRLIARDDTRREELGRRLHHLIALASRGDDAALLRALAAVAPEYQPELGPPAHAVSHELLELRVEDGARSRRARSNGKRRTTPASNDAVPVADAPRAPQLRVGT